ncbi:MAG: divergent polysaccharide deacetylase family protein [Spirochaetales bacterium]|jgi:hypothetical protein
MATVTLLALSGALAFIFGANRHPDRPVTSTTISPTTIWPYGQPEYSIEVPEGYEDLLPGDSPVTDTAQKPRDVEKAPSPQKAQPASKSEEKAETYILTVRKASQEKGIKPTLIVVIDDVGYNLEQLKPFLQLPFPISIAVLPQVDHSTEAAKQAADAGKEVLLHQPMQALGGNNPGPGAILLTMNPSDAEALMGKNLDSLPEAVGVNNHMGSAVTRDAPLMGGVLDLVKKRGIYYLDSLTAPGTVTAVLCRKLSIPYWERDVFLDNTGDKQSILRALEEGKKVASARGASVLIGHVWSAELAQTLMEIYPQLIEEGYSLSTISKYMIQSAVGDNDARSGN